jgi:hypothetical protein
MDVFQVVEKRWPTGQNLSLNTDSQSITVPTSEFRYADKFVTDGTQTYEFLFWNTGRHVTSKRRIHWNFSVGGWGLWTATKWYGKPGIGPTVPRVRVDPFSIKDDGPITGQGTAISNSSTYAPGAFPFNADDHEIGTANGPAVVIAQDRFAGLEFAGWLQLIWGGDDSPGDFVETDTGASMSTYGFFETVNAGSNPFSENQGGSADLLALYGNSVIDLSNPKYKMQLYTVGDLRFALETFLNRTTQPGGSAIAEFQTIAAAAPLMTAEELRGAVERVRSTIEVGNTALASLRSQLNKTEQ